MVLSITSVLTKAHFDTGVNDCIQDICFRRTVHIRAAQKGQGIITPLGSSHQYSFQGKITPISLKIFENGLL